MQLDNAIMYLQNALVAIQNEISNETRYTLLYKFINRAHIIQMQHSYNDAHAKFESDLLPENLASGEESKEKQGQKESKQLQPEYGDDNFKYELPEFPTTHDDLQTYNREVKERIEKKY